MRKTIERPVSVPTHWWRCRAARLLAAVSITFAAAVLPLALVGADGPAPAEVEAKVLFEDDEFLTPTAGAIDKSHGHAVDLGAHGPTVTAPIGPFLEVPEDPPKLA